MQKAIHAVRQAPTSDQKLYIALNIRIVLHGIAVAISKEQTNYNQTKHPTSHTILTIRRKEVRKVTDAEFDYMAYLLQYAMDVP